MYRNLSRRPINIKTSSLKETKVANSSVSRMEIAKLQSHGRPLPRVTKRKMRNDTYSHHQYCFCVMKFSRQTLISPWNFRACKCNGYFLRKFVNPLPHTSRWWCTWEMKAPLGVDYPNMPASIHIFSRLTALRNFRSLPWNSIEICGNCNAIHSHRKKIIHSTGSHVQLWRGSEKAFNERLGVSNVFPTAA